jgi:hypothetical protein
VLLVPFVIRCYENNQEEAHVWMDVPRSNSLLISREKSLYTMHSSADMASFYVRTSVLFTKMVAQSDLEGREYGRKNRRYHVVRVTDS